MEKTLLENICEQIRMVKEEQFCRKIYDMVQDYCCKKDFHISKEEYEKEDIGIYHCSINDHYMYDPINTQTK